MAGLINANLPSDDEEDDDYNPIADDTAEREDLPQSAANKRGTSNKRRRGAAVAASAGEGDEDEEGEAAADDEEEEDEEEDEETRAARDPRYAAKRAKLASLWEQINARAAANGSGVTEKLPSAKVNLAALCRSSSSAAGRKAKAADPDAIWMRSLGLLGARKQPAAATAAAAAAGGGGASTHRPPPSQQQPASQNGTAAAGGPDGEQQQPTQQLQPTSRDGTPGPSTSAAAAAAGGGGGGPSAEEKRALAAAALAAARDASAGGSRVGKVAVTEVRRFAGKDIQVTLHVDKDSKEAQKAAARAAAPPAPPPSSGLDAILAEVDKKKKVSVLDKTKADWSEYKATNTVVDEELETYKKSGEQYLDKQNFLKRAELREYEKERDIRLASDVRTRGRL